MAPRFNYIITIHNKAELIDRVLMCTLMCARDQSHIYLVLDGCTDDTEKIIDELMTRYSNVPITKVFAPDVHEILSINIGLRAANQEGEGFNIILQDDVLLADFLLEKKISALYEWGGPTLGYVSLRFGANFAQDAATSNSTFPFIEYAENAYAHYILNSTMVMPGHFTYRQVPIKSPVCLPFKLVREIGLLEERLAPYVYDDQEYAIRCLSAGYRNGIFSIRFHSELEWGGTRKSGHGSTIPMAERNMKLIREWHRDKLVELAEKGETNEIFDIAGPISKVEGDAALHAWNTTYSALRRHNSGRARLLARIRSIMKSIVGPHKRYF